jgi:hypothetical protein
MEDKGKEEESSSEEEVEQEEEHTNPKGDQTLVLGDEVIHTTQGEIYEWKACVENMPMHPSMSFFGKRRTGKSTSIFNIALHTMRHIPFGIAMSNTAYAGAWDAIMPKQQIVQGLREDVLIWFMARQKRVIETYGKEDPRTFAFIILDDVIADQKAMRWTPAINSFFVEGRHLNITVLIASQYTKGVGPMIRSNMDYIFVQPIFSVPERETLWQMEGGFCAKKEWIQFMDEVIVRESLPGNSARTPKKKVRIMVCACFEDSNIPSEKIFHWSPKYIGDLPPFRLCHKIYWDKEKELENMLPQEVEKRPDALVMRDVISEMKCLSK